MLLVPDLPTDVALNHPAACSVTLLTVSYIVAAHYRQLDRRYSQHAANTVNAAY